MSKDEVVDILEEIIADYKGWGDITENDIYIRALRYAIGVIQGGTK